MTDTASPPPSYSRHANGFHGGESDNSADMDDCLSDFSLVSPSLMSNMMVNESLVHFDLQYGPPSPPATSMADQFFTQLHESVTSLLQENAQLKDLVQHDQATMKSHYEEILDSHSQIEAFKIHQLDLQDKANATIEQLTAENKRMNDKLISLDDKVARSESELTQTCALLATQTNALESSETKQSQLQAEIQVLQSDFRKLKVSHDHLKSEKENLTEMNFELQTKLTLAETMDLNESLNSGNRSGATYQEKSSQTHDILVDEKTVENIRSQLIAEQSMNQTLTSELKTTRAKLDDMSKHVGEQEEVIRRLDNRGTPTASASSVTSLLTWSGDSIKMELQASDEKAQLATDMLDQYRVKYEELDKLVDSHKSSQTEAATQAGAADKVKLKQLQREVVNLKKVLSDDQVQKAANKKIIHDTQKELESTKAELKMYRQSYELQSSEKANKIKMLQEKCDTLGVQLVTCRESLVNKTAELEAAHFLKSAQGGAQRQSNEIDDIAALKAQIESYKADFEAERAARVQMYNEKENALLEMKRLMRKQETLQGMGHHIPERKHSNDEEHLHSEENKNSYLRTIYNTIRGHKTTRNEQDNKTVTEGATGGPETATDVSLCFCPKCDMNFQDLEALERHVDVCLDLDNPF